MITAQRNFNYDDSKDWNEYVRLGNIERLKKMDIEPTDENLRELELKDIERVKLMQEEVDRVNSLKAKTKKYFVGMKEFDNEEEAKEYEMELREIGRTISITEKAYNNSYMSDYPYFTMKRLIGRISWERKENLYCDFEVMSKLYILGKIDGIRSERASRKGLK